jgi:hypothetical protein
MTETPIYDALFVEHTIANLTADYWTAASKAPSARYGVACPTCKAAADQPCRTRGSRRVTDTHAARIKVAQR